MKNIKVLGTGCAKCQTTTQLIADIAQANQCKIDLEKVEDMAQIVAYGVMSTPAVMINETLVHVGSVPDKSAIEKWIVDDATATGTNTASDDTCCSGQSEKEACCSSAEEADKTSCCSSSTEQKQSCC